MDDLEFWDLVERSGISNQISFSGVEFMLAMQNLSEAASWMTHKILVSYQDGLGLPTEIIEKLIYASKAAKDITNYMAQCNCDGCQNRLHSEE